MKTFDEQIADVEKLDELRQRARQLQQEAIEALTAKPYLPRRRNWGPKTREAFEKNAKTLRPDWEPPGDDVEKAEMLRALAAPKPKGQGSDANLKESRRRLIKDLTEITHADSTDGKALDTVPIFRCALILQALAQTPGYALSGTSLVCFYRIVQELNEVAGPAWTSGAARAEENAQATAFITGECVRALLALEEALLQTARAAELLGQEASRKVRLRSDFATWAEQEEPFRERSLDISLAALPRVIIPLLEVKLSGRKPRAEALLHQIVATLRAVPRITSLNLPKGSSLKHVRSTKGIPAIAPTSLVEAAKSIAWNAVEQLLAAIKIAKTEPDPEALGKSVAKQLRIGAQIVRDLLRPIEPFAESVIDRQIAATSPHLKVSVDGAELVFAATLLGLVSDWNRPKVRAAYEVVHPLLSVNGRLLSIRPFDVGDKGYRINVATLEVTRRLADLVAKLDVEPEPEFVARLMLPLEYTRAPGAEISERGWMNDPQPREPKSLWWLTTIALDALGSIVRMLDETINRRVRRHFQVRQPAQLKLGLDDLFYPDFGLATWQRQDSIAVLLQDLRAHAGHGPVAKNPAYSLVLYGPPGTGKTTLVEAVSKTADVPLIEITPSDILVGGAEGVERRARLVFQALSKLTHAVILFDEFDSILLDRAKRDPEEIPTSMIEFLTPGMLPKLKALNDAAKEGRISFVLATNFVDRLDSAVTRGGRFDHKRGIYPPDVMSRLGRLLDQLKRMGRAAAIKKNRGRILKVVNRTASGPMDKLGRPSWYSMPRDGKPSGKTPLNYALTGKRYKDVQPETTYQRELDKYKEQQERRARAKGSGVTPVQALQGPYWTEWKKIEDWETKFKKSATDKMEWNQVYRLLADLVKPP